VGTQYRRMGNTVVGQLIGFLCSNGCNPGKVAAELTFFPPKPAFYRVRKVKKKPGVRAGDADATTDVDLRVQLSPDADEQNRNLRDALLKFRPEWLVAQTPYPFPTAKVAVHRIPRDHYRTRERRNRGKRNDESSNLTSHKNNQDTLFALLFRARENDPTMLHNQLGSEGSSGANKDDEQTPPLYLVYSHGNAADVGNMFHRCSMIAYALDINVLVYDYSGYGLSKGQPSEKQTYKDIQNVVTYLLDVEKKNGLHDPRRQVILYGQSVGSGPTCFYASRNPCLGVCLHSPIASGLRVLTDSRLLGCFDIYPNIDRISKVKCPTYIIHGQDDREVSVTHGENLSEALPENLRYEPWFPSAAGHNDIFLVYPEEYFQRLGEFLDFLAPQRIKTQKKNCPSR